MYAAAGARDQKWMEILSLAQNSYYRCDSPRGRLIRYSSPFTEAVPPRRDRSIHGVLPSVNNCP